MKTEMGDWRGMSTKDAPREHTGLPAIAESQERHGASPSPLGLWATTNPAETGF